MKKVLFATTVLASLATVASAETGVGISGYGRFGVAYDDSAVGNKTTVQNRLRFNIDATTETDSGVVFGGRLRMQSSTGNGGATLNDALLYTSFEGLRVEVGNANTAYDSAALMYNSELGYLDRSFGNPQGSFFSYDSTPYTATPDRMGVFAQYSMAGFTGRISYITTDQNTGVGVNEEISISADYSTDMFTVSAAAAQDGAGIAGNDLWFLGAAYNVSDVMAVGLNVQDEDLAGTTAVLYGNYKMGAINLEAYVSNNDAAGNATDTGFGIGADYDLGGARLSGSIQRGYAEQVIADVGVRFDF